MSRTLQLALMVINAVVALLEVYAKRTPDERDNEVAAALRRAVNQISALLMLDKK